MWLQEAKHQRLMKVKLKDVEFHTDKIMLRESEKENRILLNATVTKANKILYP